MFFISLENKTGGESDTIFVVSKARITNTEFFSDCQNIGSFYGRHQ
jgi:hypothetical protein